MNVRTTKFGPDALVVDAAAATERFRALVDREDERLAGMRLRVPFGGGRCRDAEQLLASALSTVLARHNRREEVRGSPTGRLDGRVS